MQMTNARSDELVIYEKRNIIIAFKNNSQADGKDEDESTI